MSGNSRSWPIICDNIMAVYDERISTLSRYLRNGICGYRLWLFRQDISIFNITYPNPNSTIVVISKAVTCDPIDRVLPGSSYLNLSMLY